MKAFYVRFRGRPLRTARTRLFSSPEEGRAALEALYEDARRLGRRISEIKLAEVAAPTLKLLPLVALALLTALPLGCTSLGWKGVLPGKDVEMEDVEITVSTPWGTQKTTARRLATRLASTNSAPLPVLDRAPVVVTGSGDPVLPGGGSGAPGSFTNSFYLLIPATTLDRQLPAR